MRISLAHPIHASTEEVIAAAEAWLAAEGADAPITHAAEPDGAPSIGVEQLQDGIVIATRFVARPQPDSTRVEFTIRMYGTSFGSKVRNVGMLPMTRIVRKEAVLQFQQFVESLEPNN